MDSGIWMHGSTEDLIIAMADLLVGAADAAARRGSLVLAEHHRWASIRVLFLHPSHFPG